VVAPSVNFLSEKNENIRLVKILNIKMEFTAAIHEDNYKELNDLCQKKHNLINKFGKDGCTPLTFAIINRNIKCIYILLNFGANVNTKDKNGITPLIALLSIIEDLDNLDSIQILEFLVKSKVNINQRDKNGLTPLMLVSKLESDENILVSILLESTQKPNLELLNDSKTALAYALNYENYNCACTLIKKGANVNFVYYTDDNFANYIFHDIVMSGPLRLVEEAIKNCKNINRYISYESGNKNSLDMSTINKNPNVTKLLLDNGSCLDFASHTFNECMQRHSYDSARIILEYLFDNKKYEEIEKCEWHLNLNCVNLLPISKFANRWCNEIDSILKRYLEKIKNSQEEISINGFKCCPLCRGKSWNNSIVSIEEKCAICLENVTQVVRYECNHTPCCIACYSFI
jgi:ankyrin repeat protein